MRIWLDDVRPAPADGDWVWVKTRDEALTLVLDGKVDFIAFDHDLGGDGCGAGETAYPVAKLIEERAARGIQPPGWSIHSANPVGAARIKAALESAEFMWKRFVKVKDGGHVQAIIREHGTPENKHRIRIGDEGDD